MIKNGRIQRLALFIKLFLTIIEFLFLMLKKSFKMLNNLLMTNFVMTLNRNGLVYLTILIIKLKSKNSIRLWRSLLEPSDGDSLKMIAKIEGLSYKTSLTSTSSLTISLTKFHLRNWREKNQNLLLRLLSLLNSQFLAKVKYLLLSNLSKKNQSKKNLKRRNQQMKKEVLR